MCRNTKPLKTLCNLEVQRHKDKQGIVEKVQTEVEIHQKSRKMENGCDIDVPCTFAVGQHFVTFPVLCSQCTSLQLKKFLAMLPVFGSHVRIWLLALLFCLQLAFFGCPASLRCYKLSALWRRFSRARFSSTCWPTCLLLHSARCTWYAGCLPRNSPSPRCAWVCPPALSRRRSLWQRGLCCCRNRLGLDASRRHLPPGPL